MTSVDSPEHEMSTVTIDVVELLILSVEDAPDFRSRCPAQYGTLIACSALVYYWRLEVGDRPVLASTFSGQFKNESAQ
jgi:hypothetical protein